MTPLSQITSLARSGSPARAWALFVEAGWDKQISDPKALSLKGRLLKDQAKAAQNTTNLQNQMRLYDEAATAYAQAAAIKADSYPLINAASLSLLGSKKEHSAKIAAHVIELLENNPDEGENAYWRGATKAEALLLMGQESEARAALSHAIEQIPHAWEDHAATIAQFSAILLHQGRSRAWLDEHRPPCSIHYSGIIRLENDDISSKIDDYIDTEKPSFAYGSLAAGADILFAQSFLRYKNERNPEAELHITLPFPIDQFLALSVAPFGEKWIAYFEEVLPEADSVTIMGLEDPPYRPAVALADTISMGQALRHAQNLQSVAKAFTIIGEREKLRQSLQSWRDKGYDLSIVEAKRNAQSSGEFAFQDSASSLKAILWVEGELPPNLQAIGDWQKEGQAYYCLMDKICAAYELAQNIMQCEDIQISLIYDIMDQPSHTILQRAKTIARISNPNVILCDYNSAMALEYENIAQSIEEIGELKSAWGAQSLWRII